MKVLCDLHHGDLYYSLQLLFEKRLGAEIYRPVGLEWYTEGYWNVYNHISTAKQYLDFNSSESIPKDVHGNELPESLWGNVDWRLEDGIYYIMDFAKDHPQRGVTFEKMKSMKFDIIIASMPNHLGPFVKLVEKFQPQAKLIFQIGNPGWHVPPQVKNVLTSSVAPRNYNHDTNEMIYHQEFDLDTFKYVEPVNHKNANSFIHYMQEQHVLNQYKQQLPDWKFKTYGAGMEDNLCKTKDIAKTMQDSGWIWHMKPSGDGYGHIIHNAFASGRPAIINSRHYRNSIAEKLFIDNVTCIDIGRHTLEDNIKTLQRLSEPEEHGKMCLAARAQFDKVVNFDEEEVLIRQFITNLR